MTRPPRDWTKTVERTRTLIADPATEPVIRQQLVETMSRYERRIADLLSVQERLA